jgi:DNA-binding CsgD family transcriptional regulator
MTNQSEKIELTATETRILEMLAGNMTDKEIAFGLDISDSKFNEYSQNVCKKFGAAGRAEAVRIAIKLGFVKFDL